MEQVEVHALEMAFRKRAVQNRRELLRKEAGKGEKVVEEQLEVGPTLCLVD